jgi:outer membrane protein assembly factor BamE (lipoprotein component of BamABCDE complex)
MKSILLFVIILSITGCYLTEPQDPDTSTSTTLTKKQVKYMWSQVDRDMTKEEVTRILGDPADIQNSEDVESWKYEYDIARTYGIVGFRRSDERVWFLSKPSF